MRSRSIGILFLLPLLFLAAWWFLDRFVYAKHRAGFFINSVGMRMIAVVPGDFTMGSPESERDRNPDETPRPVRMTRRFYLGETEVTNAQWRAVMGGETGGAPADRPVEGVSWNGAVAFCKKLSQRENRLYRLPTEAEWEYACRAGGSGRYGRERGEGGPAADPSGAAGAGGAAAPSVPPSPALSPWISIVPREKDAGLEPVGWYAGNCEGLDGVRSVATKRPNAWGFHDMHGNVWEWCGDYYAAPAPPGDGERRPETDPKGPPSGVARVMRGGSYQEEPYACRAAYRDYGAPLVERTGPFGLRVACDP